MTEEISTKGKNKMTEENKIEELEDDVESVERHKKENEPLDKLLDKVDSLLLEHKDIVKGIALIIKTKDHFNVNSSFEMPEDFLIATQILSTIGAERAEQITNKVRSMIADMIDKEKEPEEGSK